MAPRQHYLTKTKPGLWKSSYLAKILVRIKRISTLKSLQELQLRTLGIIEYSRLEALSRCWSNILKQEELQQKTELLSVPSWALNPSWRSLHTSENLAFTVSTSLITSFSSNISSEYPLMQFSISTGPEDKMNDLDSSSLISSSKKNHQPYSWLLPISKTISNSSNPTVIPLTNNLTIVKLHTLLVKTQYASS